MFQYFYGTEGEQYRFFRIPKVFIKDAMLKEISIDEKLLYALMLDRMSLSMKNGWLDSKNRVYIIYTVNEIMLDLNCAKQKAIKLLNELDISIGLIERKRQGLGKPNIIYCLQITDQYIEYIYFALKQNTTEVRNIRAFFNYCHLSGSRDLRQLV